MPKYPNDDLFEGTAMSFGEHLEELRRSLFRSLIGLVIGFLLGLLVANHVVTFLQGPLTVALDDYYLKKALKESEIDGEVPPEMVATIQDDHLIPVKSHVEPAAILNAMRLADPEGFRDIRFKPYRFVADDLIPEKELALAERLQADGKADTESPGGRLWKLLSGEQQQIVAKIAEQESVSDDDRLALIGVLNSLADNPAVHNSAEFRDSSAELPKAARKTPESLYLQLDTAAENDRPLDADTSRRLNRLLIAAILNDYIRKPRVMLVDVPVWKSTETHVQALNAQEGFMIWVKAAFVCGLVIASPWIFYQIWQFVAAGLYPHEKNHVYIYLPMSLSLFLAGAALAFFYVFKPVLDFLFSFNASMKIDPDPRIGEWLSFVLLMPLGFGISFQLPLVMLFINRIGLISLQAYVQKWRIAILVIFVLSMFLTPADPLSMLLMAVPLTFLYFAGILLCLWMPRGRNPFAEAYEP